MLRGIGQVSNLHYVNEDTASIEMNYIVLGETNIESAMTVEVSGSDTAFENQGALIQALRNKLTADHGVTFGPGDTVRIFGVGFVEG